MKQESATGTARRSAKVRGAVIAAMLCAATLGSQVSAFAASAAPAPSQRVVTELGQVPGLVPAATGSPAAAAATAQSGAGAHATISLKGSGSAQVRVRSNLSVTPDALPGIDAAVVTESDSQSNVVVLRDAKAANDVTFDVSGFHGKLTADELGGVVLTNPDGSWAGRISAPWAYDAKGRALTTGFSVEGSTITQHIDTAGAAFPVVADPHYTWGWITGTVYFNRHETQIIATNVKWVDIVAPFAPAPFSTILSLYAAYISAGATTANHFGLCVSVKSTGSVGIYGGSQGDGYCR